MQKLIYLCSILCFVLFWGAGCKKDNPGEQEPDYPPLDTRLNTRVKGYVRTLDGRPVPNAYIRFYEIWGHPVNSRIVVCTTKTNQFGYYQLGYNARISPDVRYEFLNYHEKYQFYEDPTVQVNSAYTQNFSACPTTFVSFRYRDKSNIRCDSFDFEWFKPYGCFKALTNQDYCCSFPASERALGPHRFTGADVHSGGYMKYYLTRFYQGAQTGSRVVDSLPMVAGDSINLWVDY